MARTGAIDRAPLSSLVPLVLQEAVSTGDPEMVQLVLQYRDYQRATQRLAGIPELLNKLRQVQQGTEVWPVRRGGEPCQWAAWGSLVTRHRSVWAACFPIAVDNIRPPPLDPSPGSCRKEESRPTWVRWGPLGGEPVLTSGVPHTRNRHRTSDVSLLVNACLLGGEFHLTQ